MRHLDEGTIHAWLDGALDDEAAGQAEAHAARCTECASAVADARGLIAASTRILGALDDVPSGVIPWGGRAGPPVTAAVRRWPAWTGRAAASIAVIAVGATLLVRRAGETLDRQSVARMGSGAETTSFAAATPAIPVAPAPAPAASAATGEAKKFKAEDGRSAVAADAPAGGAPGAESANALASVREKTDSLAPARMAARDAAAPAVPAAPVAPAVRGGEGAPSVLQAGSMNAAAKVAASAEPAATRLRLVREATATEGARVVERRVYAVPGGGEVTLAITGRRADATADSTAPAESAAPEADKARGVNSIEWTDADGTAYEFSGAIPLDSLRALRPLLPERGKSP